MDNHEDNHEIDNSGANLMERRQFLTLMGASLALGGLSCVRRPVHKIIPYLVQPEEITLGVATWYASTDPDTGLGILIKTREGRPVKLEGNPDHPLSRGKLSARAQAALLDLYDPDRLRGPLKRNSKQLGWTDADQQIRARLGAVAADRGSVRVLSGHISGDSTKRLINEFLSGFKAGAHVEYEPLGFDDLASGQAECYGGGAIIPRYDFSKAEVVLSLGADFLGTWLSPVEFAADWVKGRKLTHVSAREASLSKLICFESVFSLTGANADERYAIRPGDGAAIALAIAHEIIVIKKRSRFAADAKFRAALDPYSIESVAPKLGEKLREIAELLWRSRGKSLVVGAGDISTSVENALALQVAVNLLNSELNNDGVTVRGGADAGRVIGGGLNGLLKLIDDMRSGQVDALLIHRANPAYYLPKSFGFEEAVKKVPLVIAFSDREDETAALSDYILPDHHFLENWGDHHPREELYSLQQPAIAPLHQTRAFQDSLLSWGRGGVSRLLGTNIPSWHEYLRANWKETIYKKYKISGSFERFWELVLRKGVFESASERAAPRIFNPASLSKIPPNSGLLNYNNSSLSSGGLLSLALYQGVALHDGRQANNAWLQELPDPITTITWDNYLNISPLKARELAITKDDVVDVTTAADGFSVRVPVNIQPGLHADVVSLAVGYGRSRAGAVGTGVGVNAFGFLRTGQLVGQFVKVTKTGLRHQLAETQGHHKTENRPVINDITLADFKMNPHRANQTNPPLREEGLSTLWPQHEYKGPRWGMVIDLNACIGCGGCVVACQAENNISVVGRDQVRRGREMHWIRIDRYFSGSGADESRSPDVTFQPMLCQHCENAPCESVCPVLATVHSKEGLNEQIYNRCVGTRYCQNNCPYKVRRFNFYDNWKKVEGEKNLVWNPDVTVRTRGVIEKCTFCVQRIREGKENNAEILTACQQTCPTDAIIFGDLNNPKSMVSGLRFLPHAFKSLEGLNAKPSISYLTKVRNRGEANS